MSDQETLTLAVAARRLGLDRRVPRRWLKTGLVADPAGDRRWPSRRARLPRAEVLAFQDGPDTIGTERLNQRDDHLCFGCGRLNPFGLHLSFVAEGDGVRTDFTPGRLREGWAGATHGGILATLLDEVLAWTLFHREIWAVTARLAITYRRPAPIGAALTARGWVTQDRSRMVEVAGEVRDHSGSLVAEATGVFVRVSAEQRARLQRIYGLAGADETGG